MTFTNIFKSDKAPIVSLVLSMICLFMWPNIAATIFMVVGLFYIWDFCLEKILSQNSWVSAENVQNQLLTEEKHFMAGKISAVTLVVSIFMGNWFIFCVSLPFCLYNKWLIKKTYHAIH